MPFCFSKSAVQCEEPMSHSKYDADDTGASEEENALPAVSKFAQVVEDAAPKFQHDTRYKKGLVRYKDLKQHMNNMQNKYGNKLDLRRSECVEDECSVCLEELGHASEVTTTACGHKYHTFCLVETLGNGICTSCPLCRTDVSSLVPGGMDGSSLKLIAKLRINVDAAQWCHKVIYDEIQTKTMQCLHEVQATSAWKTKIFPLFENKDAKKDKMRARVQELMEKLDLLEQFGQINSEGFTKICKKINKKISSELADILQEKYVNEQGFHRDCVKDGNGLTHALREELKSIMTLLAAKPRRNRGAIMPLDLVETPLELTSVTNEVEA